MHQLYLVLKNSEEPPTLEKITITSGKMPLDPKSKADYLLKLEEATANTQEAFSVKEAQAALSIGLNLIQHCDIIYSATRVHGIKKNSNTCSQNGLYLVISHLTRLKKKNSSS